MHPASSFTCKHLLKQLSTFAGCFALFYTKTCEHGLAASTQEPFRADRRLQILACFLVARPAYPPTWRVTLADSSAVAFARMVTRIQRIAGNQAERVRVRLVRLQGRSMEPLAGH